MTAPSIDRGSFAPHVACSCPQCEPLHGDQAESAEQLEVYRLRAENQRLRGLIGSAEKVFDGDCGNVCPWCGGPEALHKPNCPAFSASGVVR